MQALLQDIRAVAGTTTHRWILAVLYSGMSADCQTNLVPQAQLPSRPLSRWIQLMVTDARREVQEKLPEEFHVEGRTPIIPESVLCSPLSGILGAVPGKGGPKSDMEALNPNCHAITR